MLDRTTRTFWGVGLLVAALLVILWLIVRERPVDEWWLAGLLVVGAALLFLWGRSAVAEVPASAASEPVVPPRVREFDTPAALAMPAPAESSAAPTPVEAAAPSPEPVMMGFAKAEQPVPASSDPDDLLIIEGIGPKMDAALRAEGIDTYRKVADASIADLRAAVEKHGLTLAPSLVNWSKQARYLADGDQPGFVTYRDYLVRGLEPGQVVSRDYVVTSAPAPEVPTIAEAASAEAPAKSRAKKEPASEKPAGKKAPAAPKPKKAKAEAPVTPDDLKVVEGIGPKMEKALNAAGILTFAQLAEASEEMIRAAIEKAGMRFAPSVPTWAKQASYAAKGDMDGMKAYQDQLTAGRST